MKLIVCCATPGELKTVKGEIKKLQLKKNLDIFYLCTGIGNYETIYSITNYLTANPEDNYFLINIGICGYRNQDNNKPPKSIQIGRIKNIHTNKELLPAIPFILGEIQSCYCSENILLETPNNAKEGFIDMESRGVETCCNKYNIPHIFLKVPYDRIGQETKEFNKENACKSLAENINYEEVITKILTYGEN